MAKENIYLASKLLDGLLLVASCVLFAIACQPFGSFTIVQMSDPQIGFIDESPAYEHSDSLMEAAVEAINSLHPAFVFVTGDLVNDPDDSIQDSIYVARISEIGAPVYAVPGNHDFLGYFQERRKAYIARRGYDRFSFQDRHCAFIGIDSNCIKDDAGEAEAEQWAWLEQELLSAKKCRYTFVFLHCPIIRESLDEPEDYFNFSMDKRRKYIELFKENGVDAVFAGHCHQEYNCNVDGIDFYVAGPVGNALGHGKPGYNVINVTSGGIDVSYVPTDMKGEIHR